MAEAKRPRCWKASNNCRWRTSMYRGHALQEFDLDAALAAPPAACPRRRTRAFERPGRASSETLAGRARTAGRGHRRLHHGQCPASGKPERHRWPDHGRSACSRRFRIACWIRPMKSRWSIFRPRNCWNGCAHGKVYMPQQAEHAVRNFFRKGNLIALRELALRRTADRVDAQMREYRADRSIEQDLAGARPAGGVHRPGTGSPYARARCGTARGKPALGLDRGVCRNAATAKTFRCPPRTHARTRSSSPPNWAPKRSRSPATMQSRR